MPSLMQMLSLKSLKKKIFSMKMGNMLIKEHEIKLSDLILEVKKKEKKIWKKQKKMLKRNLMILTLMNERQSS
jgi:hypothetical protein